MTAFFVRRERDIAADPVDIHDILNDFRKWVAWSPWERIDLTLRRRYLEPTSGVGARYEWTSQEPRIGSGAMTMTVSSAQLIELDVEQFEPLTARRTVRFDLIELDTGTRVRWSLRGRTGNPTMSPAGHARFVAKIGEDMERGLDLISQIVER